jgi:endonuclease III
MAEAPSKDVVATLLERHGRTYAEEAGITLRDTPSPLFRLLCLALMLSARIRADAAISAARALADAGWTTPDTMAAATWEERTKVLNESGYARYDESTSRMLGQTTDLLIDRYGGDLRNLRDEAGRDPDAERRLLQRFTGIGSVGASIFSREVQAVWDEMLPYADDRALEVARDLGLGSDAEALRGQVDDADKLTRLVAALVRSGLADDGNEIIESARSRV